MSIVVIAGVGAVGSWAVQLVARMEGVTQVTLVDPDVYEEGNFHAQNIERGDVGQPKVVVQAARLRAINPALTVHTYQARIEEVPAGIMRRTLILCCLDNRRGRQVINRLAYRFDSIWLDSAVNAPSQFRVATYVPGEDQPCLECPYDERSYELLEQEYPCAGGDVSVPPTGAAAELGAGAAAMLATQLRRVLECKDRTAHRSGVQLMFDTSTGEAHLTHFRRNPDCRFDHKRWTVSELDMAVETHTLADLFHAVGAGAALGIEGQAFVTRLDCAHCAGSTALGLRLIGRTKFYCDECGAQLLASGFATQEELRECDLDSRSKEMLLEEIGFRNGDVVSVADATGDSVTQQMLGDSCRV